MTTRTTMLSTIILPGKVRSGTTVAALTGVFVDPEALELRFLRRAVMSAGVRISEETCSRSASRRAWAARALVCAEEARLFGTRCHRLGGEEGEVGVASKDIGTAARVRI
ncbi:hypothetical protein GCM10009673_01540 [Nesterenkonia sandarakina]